MPRRNIILLCLLALVCLLAVGYNLIRSDASDPATRNSSTNQPNKSNKTSTPTSAPEPLDFDKNRLSKTDPTSLWVVVNKKHPLTPKNYIPGDLQAVGSGQMLRAEAATALAAMFASAKQAGLTLSAASAYRSYDTQVSVYANEVNSNGQAVADSQSARPGYSEHQTGLAVDIAGGGCSITDCFGNTAEGKWVAANAHSYGYIMRFGPDDRAITGYRGESWHFRYVGRELAEELHNSGTRTLEQYFDISGGEYQ